MNLLPETLQRKTTYRLRKPERMDLLLDHVEKIIREIPVFELENRPEPAAARLSYETMSRKAKEMGL